MMKTGVLARAAMCLAFFALTVICAGCPENKPTAVGGGGGNVNFKGRTCPGGTIGQKYEIEVVASQEVFKDPADADIVVCGGDKVSWFIQSPTGVITVVFTDPDANELFEHGPTNLQSHAGSPKSEIGEQTVKLHAAAKIYKYNIKVVDGTKKGEKDPHVIPMGNGGP